MRRVEAFGVSILGLENDHLRFAVRGEAHEPAHMRKIQELQAVGQEVEG